MTVGNTNRNCGDADQFQWSADESGHGLTGSPLVMVFYSIVSDIEVPNAVSGY